MKNKKNISVFFSLIIVATFFIIPFMVQAQDDTTTTPPPVNNEIKIKIDNPFKQSTIEGLIETIVNDILLPIGGVVAVLMIIYAGFLFVTARGNEAQITKAKDALLWAVIGAAILLGAWVISQAIKTTIDQLRT